MTSALRRALGAILTLALIACSSPPAASQPPAECPTSAPTAAEATTVLADAQRAEVATNLGSFTIELDASSAPVATANFVLLARCGFYAGISFHRVIADFVAQAGDPQTRSNRGPFEGLGGGGPGYQFEVELPDESQPYDQYVVAMANAILLVTFAEQARVHGTSPLQTAIDAARSAAGVASVIPFKTSAVTSFSS